MQKLKRKRSNRIGSWFSRTSSFPPFNIKPNKRLYHEFSFASMPEEIRKFNMIFIQGKGLVIDYPFTNCLVLEKIHAVNTQERQMNLFGQQFFYTFEVMSLENFTKERRCKTQRLNPLNMEFSILHLDTTEISHVGIAECPRITENSSNEFCRIYRATDGRF